MITGLVRLGILKGMLDELMENNAHRPYFMHGLSHWLGLDVHDVGRYDVDRSRLLEPGMVLTVEPGLIAADADAPYSIAASACVLKTISSLPKTATKNLTAGVVKKPTILRR